MKVPTFRVECAEDGKKTLADVPEWTLVECDYRDMCSIIRFRIGDFAYDTSARKSPRKQYTAKEYTVKKVIGQIVCE